MEKQAHTWVWIDQGERYAFGDKDRPYTVDYYQCTRCKKVVAVRGTGNPSPGYCPGGGDKDDNTQHGGENGTQNYENSNHGR